jgi:hypothetical protein
VLSHDPPHFLINAIMGETSKTEFACSPIKEAAKKQSGLQ